MKALVIAILFLEAIFGNLGCFVAMCIVFCALEEKK